MIALTGIEAADTNTIYKETTIDEVTVTSASAVRHLGGAVNGVSIGRQELFRAACCNLGESFSTNPSVDVSYSDAATGARQIRLLGLSGTYVQMLVDNIPCLRGAAQPYSLSYVPGSWMKSIQVSKGNAGVKYGYESITGQINVDYKKPEDESALGINVYGNSKARMEANMEGNLRVGSMWSTLLMAHFENSFDGHDANDDGFYDKPKTRQLNVRNHWTYQGRRYAFRYGMGAIAEEREGGQTDGDFAIDISTRRYDAYMKHAYTTDADHNGNIALVGTVSMHRQSGTYGTKKYYVNQKNAYGAAMYETDIGDIHNMSAGLNINYDYYSQAMAYADDKVAVPSERETTIGGYAQYTLNKDDKWIVMAGLRIDHSSRWGTFVTPRLHAKWAPSGVFSLRLSAGKGYRTVNALAENSFLIASGRQLTIDDIGQEEAWNMGACCALNIGIGGKTLKINAEYYYTTFASQAVVDYDTDRDIIYIYDLDGDSYSHTMQIDASYPLFKGFTITAAYRRNKVKVTYQGGHLMDKPLTSRYKALVTAQYKTPLELWQIDVTLQLNGGGRMPTPYTLADGTLSWSSHYHSFEQLSAQVTRDFRHFSVYVGGENLTDFTQRNPIINASDPWSSSFDPTMTWGPVEGIMVYAGVRIEI